MPIKLSLTEAIATVERKSIKEYTGDAQIVSVSEYRGQSGKLSIRVEFDVEGARFSTYCGLTENSIKFSLSRITHILIAAVGEEKAKEIFAKCAEDEDVNSERELAIALAQKTNAKLRNATVMAHVERTIAEKDDDGHVKRYSVKWYIPAEAKTEAKTDPLFDSLDD